MSIQRSAAAPRVANSRYHLVSLPRLPRKRPAGAEVLEEVVTCQRHDGPAAPADRGTGRTGTRESVIQRKFLDRSLSSSAGILE